MSYKARQRRVHIFDCLCVAALGQLLIGVWISCEARCAEDVHESARGCISELKALYLTR